MKSFTDKVAVVTGGASGIGQALGKVFAEQGMKIVLADIEAPALEKAAADLQERGTEVLTVVVDVRKGEDVQRLADRTLERFGAVHIVCNNAGVFSGGTLWETPVADYEWMLGVNLWGVIHGIRSFVPILLDQGTEAHILNTASMAGLTAMPFAGVYHVTKHAVVALSECLHHELIARGGKVKVSILCPEMVSTHIDQAERNRPVELAGGLDTPEARMVQEHISAGMKVGVAPRVLAERALQGIRDERFYLLSEDGWRDCANTRLDQIRDARNPTLDVPV